MANSSVHLSSHRVLYGDTDAAGVVYYANYLKYFEIGRTELMRDWVVSYKQIEELDIILPVSECYTRFKAPARYDDVLSIETTVAELKKYSCRFNYRIFRSDAADSRPPLLVKGYTVNVSINRAGKLVPLPEEILNKLAGLSQI